MQYALAFSCVTAAIYGWLAVRGSGQWWTGFATAFAVWGLVTIVPILVGGMFSAAAGGKQPAEFVNELGAPLIALVNVGMLAWLYRWTKPQHPLSF